METVEVRQGTDWDRVIALRDGLGDVITSYLDTDTLEAVVWPGDDQGVLIVPSVAWMGGDASSGRVQLSGDKEDVNALVPGVYYLLVKVNRGGRTKEAFNAYFSVLPGPGLAAALKSYCSVDDMRDRFPAIDDLQKKTHQAGFADIRARVRRRVDALILAHYRGDRAWLAPILEAGGLIRSDAVTELAALWSLAEILNAQIPDQPATANGKPSGYQQSGQRVASWANNLAKCLVAEIDTNGDGRPDITVNCSEVLSSRG